LPPDALVIPARLRAFARCEIDAANPRFRDPLVADARALGPCAAVLLGSVASRKYVAPLLQVFGDRLLFPRDFVGRGDMSRGGLLLRCAAEGRALEVAPVQGALRRGPRAPKLAPPRPPRWRHCRSSSTRSADPDKVSGMSAHALDAAERDHLAKHGYVLREQVFDAGELEAIRASWIRDPRSSRPSRKLRPETAATEALSSPGSTGFARWSWNPAESRRTRSSTEAKAVSASVRPVKRSQGSLKHWRAPSGSASQISTGAESASIWKRRVLSRSDSSVLLRERASIAPRPPITRKPAIGSTTSAGAVGLNAGGTRKQTAKADAMVATSPGPSPASHDARKITGQNRKNVNRSRSIGIEAVSENATATAANAAP